VQHQGRRDPTIAVNEHIGKARFTAAAFFHSSLDYQTPAEAETEYYRQRTPPPSTCSRPNRPGTQPGASPPVVVIRSRP